MTEQVETATADIACPRCGSPVSAGGGLCVACGELLAAKIADAETQFRHYQDERLRLWRIAREHGWSLARIGEAAGLERTTIHYAIRRAERSVETATAAAREGDDV